MNGAGKVAIASGGGILVTAPAPEQFLITPTHTGFNSNE